MKKYYYYTYKGDKFYGMGITCSESGCFPISETIKFLQEKNKVFITVDFWEEISYNEYKNMSKLIENQHE